MLFLERNNVSLELSRLSVTTQAEISPLLTTLSNAMKNQLKAPKTPAFTYTCILELCLYGIIESWRYMKLLRQHSYAKGGFHAGKGSIVHRIWCQQYNDSTHNRFFPRLPSYHSVLSGVEWS